MDSCIMETLLPFAEKSSYDLPPPTSHLHQSMVSWSSMGFSGCKRWSSRALRCWGDLFGFSCFVLWHSAWK